MKKIIKSYGNTLVIVFNSEDQQAEKLKKGDIIEFSITKIIRGEKKK